MKNLYIFIVLALSIVACNVPKMSNNQSLTSSFINKKGFKTENIIFITLDGVRWSELFYGADSVLINSKTYVNHYLKDTLLSAFDGASAIDKRKKLMPFMWSTIVDNGALYGNRNEGSKVNVANTFWFSSPGYAEIVSGFADDETVFSNDKIYNPNENFLQFLNAKPEFENKVACFASWEVLDYVINEPRSKVLVNSGYENVPDSLANDRQKHCHTIQENMYPIPWNTVRADAITHDLAFEYLKEHKPRMLYIVYGETDDFAHDKRYDQYLLSMHKTDRFISEIWQWCQSQEQYKDKTTLLIATDHGRGMESDSTWESHGNWVKNEKKISFENSDQTWFAAIGPDIRTQGMVKTQAQYYNNQYAATICHLLGYDYTANKQVGEVITDILKK